MITKIDNLENSVERLKQEKGAVEKELKSTTKKIDKMRSKN